MNIKFGMDNYYVRYLKRFLNHELGISNRVLGEFDKNDQAALISYLNLPNVKNMFEVQKEMPDRFPELSNLFNCSLKNNEIVWTGKQISKECSDWIHNNLDSITSYCKSVGWLISSVYEWFDESKDINQDGIIDRQDSLIVYNLLNKVETYDEPTTQRADLDLDDRITQNDLDIITSYLENNKLQIIIKQENRKNYFPNEDMKVFVNQFDGSFMYNYAIRDNGVGQDDLPHPNNSGRYKIAVCKCTPGQKLTIAHNSSRTEHLVIGSSNVVLKESIAGSLLQKVVEIDLRPGEGYQYTTSSTENKTGYDAEWVCIQCPSSYIDLNGGKQVTLTLEKGDINFDGKIDMEDYLILADYTATGPNASSLKYNKANWTPSRKQLGVMNITATDGNGFGQDGLNDVIDRNDAIELYKFITGTSSHIDLGWYNYTYTTVDNSDEDADNVDNLLIIDGHYYNYDANTKEYQEGKCLTGDVNIPFEEFTSDSWIVHDKFFNYLLNMAVHKYSTSEDISYMQKLIKLYYPENYLETSYLYPGDFSDKMKQLVLKYQTDHTAVIQGDLNLDEKIDKNDLELERRVLETLNADINGDGVIDQKDFDLLKHYIDGTGTLTTEQLEKADVNFDGVIDNKDLQIIQEFIDGTRQDTVHLPDGAIGEQQLRADTNKDGKWNGDDYKLLEQQVNGETTILDNYVIPFMLGWVDVQTEALLEQELNTLERTSEVSK